MAAIKNWLYRHWLVVPALVYLVLAWGLAIYHLPKPIIEEKCHRWSGVALKNILYRNELIYSAELPILFWLFVIIIVASIQLCLKHNQNIVLVGNLFLFATSLLCSLVINIYNVPYIENSSADKEVHQWGGVVLCLWASSIIVILFSTNHKWPNPGNHLASTVFLAFIFSLSLLIYFFPNTRLKDHDALSTEVSSIRDCRTGVTRSQSDQQTLNKNVDKKNNDEQGIEDDRLTSNDIEKQYDKAVQEINLRTQIDDSWFHNKFILVGALFGAFLTWFGPFNPSFRGKDGHSTNRWSIMTTQIAQMFKTSIPSSILGVACIVSLAIDLHMRNNAMITRQLGLWIKHFVECIFSHRDGYIGWETFLRLDIYGAKGMHMQILFGVLDAAHFYFTSIILYVLYISCLIYYFSNYNSNDRLSIMNPFALVFVLVHFTLFIFSVGGNSFPSALEVQLALWPNQWFSGGSAAVIPAAICLLVSYLAFMRLFTLYKNRGASDA